MTGRPRGHTRRNSYSSLYSGDGRFISDDSTVEQFKKCDQRRGVSSPFLSQQGGQRKKNGTVKAIVKVGETRTSWPTFLKRQKETEVILCLGNSASGVREDQSEFHS